MSVKIVTDSLGDISADLAKKLDITVIPINLFFGKECFKDGIDMTTEQFYARLVTSKTLPTTSTPTLGTFIDAFDKLQKESDEIVVLTISHKLSGTFDTAARAAEMMSQKPKKIKVIDTLQVIMGQGLIAIQAAKAAKAGASFDEIVKQVGKNIRRVESRMAFETLDYLKRGGRIGAGQALLSSILKLNPVLYLKGGEVFPLARERSHSKAITFLYSFVQGYSNIEAIAVEDATTPDEADKLAQRLKTKFPDKPIYRSKVSPVIGTHVGPNIIAISVLGDKKVQN